MLVNEKIILLFICIALGIGLANYFNTELWMVLSIGAVLAIGTVTANQQMIAVIVPIGISFVIIGYIFMDKGPDLSYAEVQQKIVEKKAISANLQAQLKTEESKSDFFDSPEVDSLEDRIDSVEDAINDLQEKLDSGDLINPG